MTILLLNKKSVTAKELSERFNVSTRTIYRDIDVLSAAGVPVYANRGAGGGIALLENYALNKAIISSKESESILFALKTLQATKYPEIDGILDKLGAIFHNAATDWIHIDFSPWASGPNEYDRLSNIKKAILGRFIVEFDYINAQNQKTQREVEPLRLLFKEYTWYLWGWDLMRDDYRMFRISRIKYMNLTNKIFDRANLKEPEQKEHVEVERSKPLVLLELKFNSKALYKLYDDYDDDVITKNPEGTYTLKVQFPEDEWVYGYVLSFGPNVEVISPEHIKSIIKEKAKKILEKY